jgi:glycine cleavage system aminomethyltransferase T
MYAVLGLMGPRARAVLSQLTDADLSNAAFPFGTFQIHLAPLYDPKMSRVKG